MTVLNKYIASSGFCSRRKAVEHIKAQEVYVNNEIILEPFYKVSASDLVQVKDKIIRPQKFQYFVFNKSKNVICTLSDPGQRKTIADIFSNVSERVYPIGRLDRNTTGVIVVTNDGNLNQKLAHPKYEVKKIYNVTLDKSIAPYHFNLLLKGLNLFDGFMKVDNIYYSSEKHKRSVSVVIHSGKNHIIKRLFQEIDFKVMKLDRVYYGGLTKKNLPLGTYRKLSHEEIEFLKSDQRASKDNELAPEAFPVSASPLKRRKPAAAAPDNRRGEPVRSPREFTSSRREEFSSNRPREFATGRRSESSNSRREESLDEKRFVNNITSDARTSRTTRTLRALSAGRFATSGRTRTTGSAFENQRSEFDGRAPFSTASSENKRFSGTDVRRSGSTTRSNSSGSARVVAPLLERDLKEFNGTSRSANSNKPKGKSFTGKRPNGTPQRRSKKAESALNRMRRTFKKKRS
jgi:pseudouridine synthase